jgi:hypothetical protein
MAEPDISMYHDMNDHNHGEPIRVAKIDGQEVNYTYCGDEDQKPTSNKFVYLGYGTIHSINGVVQVGATKLHFWRAK